MYAELKQRVCATCKESKFLTEFGKDASKFEGRDCYCRPCKKKWRAELRKSQPERHSRIDFAADLMKNYGITVEQHDEMYKNQKGCCDCCGRPESTFKRRLHVDHCAETGQVRALLCTQCNPGIGYFEHSVERLEMAIKYLKKFKK